MPPVEPVTDHLGLTPTDASPAIETDADDGSDLPILRYQDEIVAAVRDHPVVIICGETGSGKSTQLPRLLMNAGFAGKQNADDPAQPRPCRIAHTQPRRVAAMSLAKRIGEEVLAHDPAWAGKLPVGYKIRFEDKIADETVIKLMTDGILIAETAHDHDLRQYGVIIIDEAHERSLNIDFLMGYLRALLTRRVDLRVIITSATLDAEHFSQFFTKAPVINVEGRSFPVTLCYRPLEGAKVQSEDKEDDKERNEQRDAWREDKREARLPQAIGEAILDLWHDRMAGAKGGLGDVLVFLPGEGEIRAVMDYLPGFFAKTRFSPIEVLPLMSRLSSKEQMKIFHPTGPGLRVILATNIAETSLTVPRIRYVIDSGLSRVLRYSPRMKINRLEIEPIAQDSAKQRAGRCGRVRAGVCVRLYDEDDFNARPAQSTPEILRSSLALVILRLLALQWGDIRDFPWIDPPSPRMIHHGLVELTDLGAINASGKLTPLGQQMARIPIDHTLSRMLIEADRKKILAETLIIVSALSTREVRELPLDAEERARQAHRAFEDERSDFLTLINLWHQVETARQSCESQSAFRKWCRTHYLSWLRLREWRELHLQLQTQLRRLFPHYRPPSSTSSPHPKLDDALYKAIHQAILCGIPTQIGRKHDTENFYLGPRGLKFFADRRWMNRKARWIVCGEMMATPRPMGRRIGKIESAWIVEALPHLLEIKWLEPFWDKGQQAVMIHRQISLQGLMIEPRQRVSHQPQTEEDWTMAEAVFIRGAFIEGEINLPTPHHLFFQHNEKVLTALIEQENRVRRPGTLVDDDKVFHFYRHALAKVAPRAINTRTFLHAYKAYLAEHAGENPLMMDVQTWKDRANLGQQEDFPGEWVAGELRLPIRYTFAPGSEDDGMTITLDEALLSALPRHLCDWLVPGMRVEKVEAAIKTLPKKLRFALRQIAADFVRDVPPCNTPLLAKLAQYCSEQLRQPVPANLFREENLPLHLKMRIRVVNPHGAVVLETRNPAQIEAHLAARHASHTPHAQKASPPLQPHTDSATITVSHLPHAPLSTWSKAEGNLPRQVPMTLSGQNIKGWAALTLENEHVFIRAFVDKNEALLAQQHALIHWASGQLSAQIKAFRAPSILTLQLPQAWFADDTALKNAVVHTALAQVIQADPLPDSPEGFAARVKEAKTRFLLIADSHLKLLQQLATLYKQTQTALQHTRERALREDGEQTLSQLFTRHFFQNTPSEQLRHLPRFTEAILRRIENYPKNPARDQKNAADIQALGRLIQKHQDSYRLSPRQVAQFRWLMEELRVGLFAQTLKTTLPISVKRLEKMIEDALG